MTRILKEDYISNNIYCHIWWIIIKKIIYLDHGSNYIRYPSIIITNLISLSKYQYKKSNTLLKLISKGIVNYYQIVGRVKEKTLVEPR